MVVAKDKFLLPENTTNKMVPIESSTVHMRQSSNVNDANEHIQMFEMDEHTVNKSFLLEYQME